MILRWYIDGNIARVKTEVGGVHTLDKDYTPESVEMTVRIAGVGSTPMILDINDDGVSIFEYAYRPAITENQTEHKWTTIQPNVMREGSKITLDIDQIFSMDTARDLTVELTINEV